MQPMQSEPQSTHVRLNVHVLPAFAQM